MKKLIVILLVLLAAATVSAEQMTINLRSGNRVVIVYSGAIAGVYSQGYSDAIAWIQNTGRRQIPKQLSSTVPAERMTIDLRSGNRVVVDYFGSIGGVYVQGYTDAIAGIQNLGRRQIPKQLSSALPPGAKVTTKQAEAKNKTIHSSKDESSSGRIKWRKPIDDENLKNARSDSRVVNWFK